MINEEASVAGALFLFFQILVFPQEQEAVLVFVFQRVYIIKLEPLSGTRAEGRQSAPVLTQRSALTRLMKAICLTGSTGLDS